MQIYFKVKLSILQSRWDSVLVSHGSAAEQLNPLQTKEAPMGLDSSLIRGEKTASLLTGKLLQKKGFAYL